jgi:hypothetical protein
MNLTDMIRKKLDIKDQKPHDSSYMVFKYLKNSPIETEVRRVILFGGRGMAMSRKDHKGTFWGNRNVLHLYLDGYASVRV